MHPRLDQVTESKAFRRFGLILPLALLVAITVVSAFDLDKGFIFNPLGLILILHTIFLTATGVIVSIVSAKSYLRQGNLSILLMGTAVLAFAVVALVGAILTFGFATLLEGVLLSNYGTIINNITTCAASAVQVISAIVAFVLIKSIEPTKRKPTLTVAYLGVVVFIAALTAVTFSGIVPVFLTSQSPTLLRTTVLGVTVFLFASSCILFFWRYQKSKVKTLYWYSLALGLFSIAFLSFMLQIQLSDSFGWIGRIAEYSGGIFFIVALLQPAVGVDADADVSGRWAEAFRGNRAQFAALFNNMLDAFVFGKAIFDKNGKPVDTIILEVNEAFEKITGIKKENAIGKKASELVPGVQDDPAGWIAIYGRVAITGEPTHFENYLQPLSKWYHVSSYSPKKGYFVSIFEDITERKKAEEALRNAMQQTDSNRKRLETILETSPSAIVVIEAPDSRFSLVNKRAQELYGIDFRGVDLATNVARVKASRPDGTTYAVNEVPASRALNLGEEVRNEEMIIYRADGAAIPVIVSAGPIRDAIGSIVAAIVIFEDISERKKMEEKVKQGMQTFVELIERAPFGIYIINSQFRIANMNMSSQNGAFRNVRPLIGRDFNEAMHILWPEPTALEILAHFRHTLETGEPYYSPQFVNPRHDVEIVESYEWELQRMRLPDGQFGVICYYFDSTKLREAERGQAEAQAKLKEYATNLEHLIEERTKQLKDSERLAAIGATAGMVGHDIRNPLQSITSDVFLVKSEISVVPEGEEKESMTESLDEIQHNIDYINKIVADLQDYAKILKPVAKTIDLEQVCNEVLLKNNLPKSIKASCSVDATVKQVIADPDLLRRIITNLVINAVQAMPEGGKISIRAYLKKGDTIIEVQDTGVGIPEEAREKLFTPLFTTKSKGQGFGLAVVKRMTEGLGGTVEFESQEGKGTTFTIRLPPPKELNGKWTY